MSKSEEKSGKKPRQKNKKRVKNSASNLSELRSQLQSKFIKKGRGAANAVASASQMQEKVQQIQEDPNSSYQVTPKGILWMALQKYFNLGEGWQKFADFQREVLTGLAKMATKGSDPNMLGNDFNDFFLLFVKVMNLAGKMKEILQENGIEVSEEELLGENGSEDDEDEEGEEDVHK